MNCKRYQDWIRQSAVGGLDVSREAKLNAHLAGCAACRESFQAEQCLVAAIGEGLAKSLNHQPSSDFAARVRMRLAAEGERREHRLYSYLNTWTTVRAAGVAALAALVVAGWLLYHPQPPQQIARVTGGRSTQIATPGKHTNSSGPLSVTSRAERPSRRASKAAGHHPHRRSGPQNQAPHLQVLVQPGQWAAITAACRAAQSGRVDASSLIREAAEDEQPIEVKPVEIKPLEFGQVQGLHSLDSGGS